MHSSRHLKTSREVTSATLIIPKEGIRQDVLKYRLRNWFGPDATVELARSPTTGDEAYVIRNVTEKGRRTELAIIEDLKDESAKVDEAERARSRLSDTPSSRQQPTQPSIPSAQGQRYTAQPPTPYTYAEREVTVSNALFPKETLDVPRSGGYPARKSSLKNLLARHESNTSQSYSQKPEGGVDVQDSTRRPTRGLRADREWAESNDEEEEDEGEDEEEEEFADSAESQQALDRRRAYTAEANVAVQRRSELARSRIPVPALETMKERSPRPPDDPRSWSGEPERNVRLSQETLPKIAQTTVLPHRNIPEGRSKYSGQRQDSYGEHDRYGAEGGLSSSFSRKREDEDPDPDSDPDPDQPSSGGTIGFSRRHPGSRLLLEGTSTRRRPEGRHSPDPDPDQPDHPYGFSTDDALTQESQLRLDVRPRGDSRSRATPPETERSSVSRPAGHYQRDVTTSSKDRRPERPPEPSRRRSTHHTSSGTKKDDKDIYERHRR